MEQEPRTYEIITSVEQGDTEGPLEREKRRLAWLLRDWRSRFTAEEVGKAYGTVEVTSRSLTHVRVEKRLEDGNRMVYESNAGELRVDLQAAEGAPPELNDKPDLIACYSELSRILSDCYTEEGRG